MLLLRAVLILVLMEYGLRGPKSRLCRVCSGVLILVLMEYGLRDFLYGILGNRVRNVLILVLMEYGLRGSNL